MNREHSLIPPQLDPTKNKQLHDQLLQSALQKNSINSHNSQNKSKNEDPAGKKKVQE